MPSRSTNGNGESRKLVWWLMGALFLITITAAGAFGTWTRNTIMDLIECHTELKAEVAAGKQSDAEILRRLDRMETKLDQLMLRRE